MRPERNCFVHGKLAQLLKSNQAVQGFNKSCDLRVPSGLVMITRFEGELEVDISGLSEEDFELLGSMISEGLM